VETFLIESALPELCYIEKKEGAWLPHNFIMSIDFRVVLYKSKLNHLVPGKPTVA